MQRWIRHELVGLSFLVDIHSHLLVIGELIFEQLNLRSVLYFVVRCGLVHLRDEVGKIVLVMVLKRMVNPGLSTLELQSVCFSC